MITEDYVSFETAKLLKEKGFDEECQTYYGDYKYPCPTLQMTMKWLREKYNIHVEPRYFPTPNIYRYVIIRSKATFENIDSHPQYFSTNEEACEAGIRYALENLI